MSFARPLSRGRWLPRLRWRAALRRRWVRRALLAAVVLGAVALGGWLWLRDSSLVAVSKVRVTGVSGADAGAIRRALTVAARGMTTLDVDISQLRTSVSPYPVVADLQVSTQFPHGMTIRVLERPPVAVVSVGGRSIAVAGDGTLLHDIPLSSTLPVVPLAVPPGGTRLIGAALDAVKLLAAAPAALATRVSQVSRVAGHGLVAQIRGGPSVYFGDASGGRAKWIAASEVLADPGSAGAVYIDVTDPVRPAAGAGSQSAPASSSASAGASGGSAGSGQGG